MFRQLGQRFCHKEFCQRNNPSRYDEKMKSLFYLLRLFLLIILSIYLSFMHEIASSKVELLKAKKKICVPLPPLTLNSNIESNNGSILLNKPTQYAFPIVEDCLEAASISWDFIDKIVYINARDAWDRNEAMLRDFLPVFQKSDEDIIRFEALPHDSNMPKVQGTGKSHIGALQLALEGGFKNVLILEDDVLWRVSPNQTNLILLQDLVTRPYDVVILGGTFVHHDQEHRASHSYAASSYLVNGDYILSLLGNFQEGLMNLNINPNSKGYSIDVWWNRIIKKDLWYVVTPALVIQTSYPIEFGYGKDGTGQGNLIYM